MIDPNRYPALWHLLKGLAHTAPWFPEDLQAELEPPPEAEEYEELAKTLTETEVQWIIQVNPDQWRYEDDDTEARRAQIDRLGDLAMWLQDVDADYLAADQEAYDLEEDE